MSQKVVRAVLGDGECPHLGVQPGSGWVVGLSWGPGVLQVDPAAALHMGRLKGMQSEGLGNPLSLLLSSKCAKTVSKAGTLVEGYCGVGGPCTKACGATDLKDLWLF